jgi:cytochrome c oxidase subunit 2
MFSSPASTSFTPLVPRLAGKIDAVPGHVNLLRIQADARPLSGLCNEFCGHGHPGMRFDVVVHPTADFRAAIAKPDAAGKVKQ